MRGKRTTCGRLASAVLVCATAFPAASACSIFRYTENGVTYFCGNEDWSRTDPALHSVSPGKGRFGYVLFGWERYLPRYAQAGINTAGLCFDWATVPPQPFSPVPGKPSLPAEVTSELLARFGTVDEVISFLEARNFPHLAEEHLMMADRTGKSCVFEFVDGKMKILPGTGRQQYVTNFLLSAPGRGWHPCPRFDQMTAFFSVPGNLAGRLPDLLDAIHQEGPYPTIYSYVIDLSKGEMAVFVRHDFKHKKTYKVADLSARAQTIALKPWAGSAPGR